LSKILLVTSNFPPTRGGSASVYANLAQHLGSKLIILAPTRDYNDGLKLIGWREHDRRANYATMRLPLLRTTLHPPPRFTRKWMIRLWDLQLRARVLLQILYSIAVRKVRILCIGELLSVGWLIPIFRWMPGVKTVVYVHGEEITTIAPGSSEQRRARRSLLSSDKVIVVSSFTFAALRTLMEGEALNRVVLIQNGVDTKRFKPRAKSAVLEQQYGLIGKFTFVSVSRLVEKKGHDNTIRGFASVVARYPDTKLLIVGTGPYRPKLEQLCAELQLENHVTFVGAVSEDDLVDHYLLGDAFIMANRALADGDTEGFGLVFLEANSCGLAVIAGRDGGSTEAVDDKFNGLVVDGHSVSEIAEAMLALRGDPALRGELRANGLIRAAQSDWSHKAELFERACRTS